MSDSKVENQEIAPAMDDHLADHDMNAWAFPAVQELRAKVSALEEFAHFAKQRIEALEEESKPKKK